MPNLSIGLPVVVCQTANLRSTPGGERINVLSPGHNAVITSGPLVDGGLTWWELDHSGWCVESVDNEDILNVAPSSDWDRSIFFVLQQEGGYTDGWTRIK